VLSALLFNILMLLLPVASAAAVIVIARDHLYAYEYSEAGARAISTRIERLNGELIQLDFDRQRQWDDLVAMELMTNDVPAARGFLLSGAGMLPPRMGNALNRADNDAEREVMALELLTPGTRARYESMVPLLSRRAASGAAQELTPVSMETLGDTQDFELMARALLAEPETDALQFVLTGFSLGMAGDVNPQLIGGAAALLAASRRPDYPQPLREEIDALFGAAMPIQAFRDAALASASSAEAGAFANAAAAFNASVDRTRAAQARGVLNEIGAMSEAISVAAAANLLTHAATLRDLPRLRLLAQAAGDRTAAAAKRLPRDGRLLEAARGELTITRDLAAALAVAALALAGLIFIVAFRLYQSVRRVWLRKEDDDYGSELVDIGAKNWRPL
jgi:hypothetical protein